MQLLSSQHKKWSSARAIIGSAYLKDHVGNLQCLFLEVGLDGLLRFINGVDEFHDFYGLKHDGWMHYVGANKFKE